MDTRVASLATPVARMWVAEVRRNMARLWGRTAILRGLRQRFLASLRCAQPGAAARVVTAFDGAMEEIGNERRHGAVCTSSTRAQLSALRPRARRRVQNSRALVRPCFALWRWRRGLF